MMMMMMCLSTGFGPAGSKEKRMIGSEGIARKRDSRYTFYGVSWGKWTRAILWTEKKKVSKHITAFYDYSMLVSFVHTLIATQCNPPVTAVIHGMMEVGGLFIRLKIFRSRVAS
jgi:hypothetical protein